MKKQLNLQDVEHYLKDSSGNYSSTRLFSWLMLTFYRKFNYFFSAIMVLLFIMILWIFDKKDSVAATLVVYLLVFWTIWNVINLVAIFAPKQFNKVAEIKGLIEIMDPSKMGKITDDLKKERSEENV